LYLIKKEFVSLLKQNTKTTNMATQMTLTIAEKKANYILAVCKEKKRSLDYCLDYAIWISKDDTEMIEIQNVIKECYK